MLGSVRLVHSCDHPFRGRSQGVGATVSGFSAGGVSSRLYLFGTHTRINDATSLARHRQYAKS